MCPALASSSTVAVSDAAPCMMAAASSSCASAGPSEPTAPLEFGAFGAVTLTLTSPRRPGGISLDRWSLLAGPELTEGVVEHYRGSIRALRDNPNARRRLRDLKEGAPYPPNHGGASFSSTPGKAAY